MNPDQPSHLFAAGTENGAIAVFQSTDGGAHWTMRTMQDPEILAARSVGFDRAETTIYAGGGDYGKGVLFKSADGGSTWGPVAPGTFGKQGYGVTAILVDPDHPRRVVVGTMSKGILRSEDGGASWTKATPDLTVRAVRANLAAPDEMYAATSQGVYHTANHGATWTAFNDGLGPNLDVMSIDWAPAARVLAAGTSGGSAFRKMDANRRVLSLQAAAGGSTSPPPGTYLYDLNSAVTITAVPAAYYSFTGWTGDVTGTQNPLALVMNVNKAVTANFQHLIYPPNGFAATKGISRSVFLVKYFDRLTWTANPANQGIMGYRVYDLTGGGRSLLAEVSSSATEYVRWGVGKEATAVYGITSIDAQGLESAAAEAAVR